jgi:hypothetical protein
MTRRVVAVMAVTAAATLAPRAAHGFQQPRIADNSFLVEEAYNQETGVVQHISTLVPTAPGSRIWLLGFTQEFPAAGQRHQVSYTVPLFLGADPGVGVGDIAFTYRYGIAQGERLALSPRLSLLLPTGPWHRGQGSGSPGVQLALPLSVRVQRQLVLHANAGASVIPWARTPEGTRRTLDAYTAAIGVVGPVMLPVQALFEVVAVYGAEVSGPGSTARFSQVVASPGVRMAIEVGAVQVVPGVAVPIFVNGSRRGRTVLFYLSVEHALVGSGSTGSSSEGP